MFLEVLVYLCRKQKIEAQEKIMSVDRSLASLYVSFSTQIHTNLTAHSLLRRHSKIVQTQERVGNRRIALMQWLNTFKGERRVWSM